MKTQTQTKIQWKPKLNKESDWDGIELNDPETGITHASLDHCTPEAMALIAAAPAMLEALRDAANAHAHIDEEYPCGICEVNRRPQWLEDVENAIAAAENLPTG